MIATAENFGGCAVAERVTTKITPRPTKPVKGRGGHGTHHPRGMTDAQAEADVHPSDVRLCELAIQAESGNVQAVMADLRAIFAERLSGQPAYGYPRQRPYCRHDRERPADPRDLSLIEIGLCLRTANALEVPRECGAGKDRWSFPGVIEAGRLCHWSADELRQLPAIGPKGIDELRRCLGAVGLRLRGDDV